MNGITCKLGGDTFIIDISETGWAGTVGSDAGSDIWFNALTATDRYFQVRNGATLSPLLRSEPRAMPYLTSLVRRRTLLAALLLCIAMLSYQPSAMVFWPCAFLMLAAPSRRPDWRALTLPVWTATAVGGPPPWLPRVS